MYRVFTRQLCGAGFAAICAALLMTGCESGGISSAVTPDVTNAPAVGFQNLRGG